MDKNPNSKSTSLTMVKIYLILQIILLFFASLLTLIVYEIIDLIGNSGTDIELLLSLLIGGSPIIVLITLVVLVSLSSYSVLTGQSFAFILLFFILLFTIILIYFFILLKKNNHNGLEYLYKFQKINNIALIGCSLFALPFIFEISYGNKYVLLLIFFIIISIINFYNLKKCLYNKKTTIEN